MLAAQIIWPTLVVFRTRAMAVLPIQKPMKPGAFGSIDVSFNATGGNCRFDEAVRILRDLRRPFQDAFLVDLDSADPFHFVGM
jgi:hypothetical protein